MDVVDCWRVESQIGWKRICELLVWSDRPEAVDTRAQRRLDFRRFPALSRSSCANRWSLEVHIHYWADYLHFWQSLALLLWEVLVSSRRRRRYLWLFRLRGSLDTRTSWCWTKSPDFWVDRLKLRSSSSRQSSHTKEVLSSPLLCCSTSQWYKCKFHVMIGTQHFQLGSQLAEQDHFLELVWFHASLCRCVQGPIKLHAFGSMRNQERECPSWTPRDVYFNVGNLHPP